MVHNLIQDWASNRPSIAARNSYSLEVAYGLWQIAKERILDMERAAKENEKKTALEQTRLEECEQRKEHEAVADKLRLEASKRDKEQAPLLEVQHQESFEAQGATITSTKLLQPKMADDNGEAEWEGFADDDDKIDGADFKEEKDQIHAEIHAPFDDELQKFFKPHKDMTTMKQEPLATVPANQGSSSSTLGKASTQPEQPKTVPFLSSTAERCQRKFIPLHAPSCHAERQPNMNS